MLKPDYSVVIIGEFIGQDLDSDITLQFPILSSVHLPHTAFTEQAGDLILAKNCSGRDLSHLPGVIYLQTTARIYRDR